MNHLIISEDNFEKAKKRIDENQSKLIIFSSNDDELNRKVLEKLKINFLLLNQSKRKDFQKQRNSGLNSVLAKIAKKNNIGICINLDEIINSSSKTKVEIIGRVIQNIRLCNKNKLPMIFCGRNKREIHDLKCLGTILGMPTWMTKDLRLFNIN